MICSVRSPNTDVAPHKLGLYTFQVSEVNYPYPYPCPCPCLLASDCWLLEGGIGVSVLSHWTFCFHDSVRKECVSMTYPQRCHFQHSQTFVRTVPSLTPLARTLLPTASNHADALPTMRYDYDQLPHLTERKYGSRNYRQTS